MQHFVARHILCLSLFTIPGSVALGQSTIDWTGGGSTSEYEDKNNWSGGEVPDSTSETARFNVGGAYVVELPAAVSVSDLSVLNGLAQLRPVAGVNPNYSIDDDLLVLTGGGLFLSAPADDKLTIDIDDELRIDGGSSMTVDTSSAGIVNLLTSDLRLADIGSGSGSLNLIGEGTLFEQDGFAIINIGQDGPAQLTISDRARATFSAPVQLVNFADPGSTAIVLVESGSRLELNSLQIATGGANSGVSGNLSVTGPSSIASIDSGLTIGGASTPTGTVSATASGRIDVGGLTTVNPSGTLRVDGGTVNARGGLDASTGGNVELIDGTLTVSGGVFAPSDTTVTEPMWEIDGASPSDRPHLVLAAGAIDAFESTVTDGDLDLGKTNYGELSVTEGVEFRARNLFLGDSAGAKGVATVDGAGSALWGMRFSAGIDGDAEITVSDGGFLRAGISNTVGSGPNSDGLITVTDPGSLYESASGTIIGFEGAGEVRIENGAAFRPRVLTIAQSTDSTGKVVVTGAGSNSIHAGSANIGRSGNGTVEVRDKGRMIVNPTPLQPASSIGILSGGVGELLVTDSGSRYSTSGELRVGERGDGTLRVENGGEVFSGTSVAAQDAGATGMATVTGTDSRWVTTGTLSVGGTDTTAGGTATVTAMASGRIEAGGPLRVWGGSELISDGGVIDAADTITIEPGGIVTLDNNGVLNAMAGFDDTLAGGLTFVDGQLNVTGGAFVPQAPATAYSLQGPSGTPGTARVTVGAGATFDRTALTTIGGSGGRGSLTLEAGATADFGFVRVGSGPNSNGTFTVTGDTTAFTAFDLNVAFNKSGGSLAVLDGGQLRVNALQTGTGFATLQVIDGTLEATTDIRLGGFGDSSLYVASGGQVQTQTLRVGGDDAGEEGDLLLELGGEVLIGGSLFTGSVGRSSFSIDSGGLLQVADSFFLNPNTEVFLTAFFTTEGGRLEVGSLIDRGGSISLRTGSLTVNSASQDLLVTPVGVSIAGVEVVLESPSSTPDPTTIKEGQHLDLAGGALVATGATMTLESGGSLAVSGLTLATGARFESQTAAPADLQVNGPLQAATGSVIEITDGDVTLGDAAAVNGVYIGGQLHANGNIVVLADANDVVLDSGALATLAGGEIEAANGLTLDFGGNATGHGDIITPNDATKPLTNNGHIAGDSMAQPITLSGYVKGVGTLDNVVITGTDAPGFSPAAVSRGSVTYAGVLEIELSGDTPGSEHDQLNHILGTGLAELGGSLEVQTINGFQPMLGDTFDIITASGGISGEFNNISSGFEVIYSTASVQLVATSALGGDYNNDGVVDAADYTVWRDNLDAPAGTLLNDFAGGMIGSAQYDAWVTNFGATLPPPTVAVPEPATLVMMAFVVALFVRARPRKIC